MILAFAAFALADVPPGPGYVETCTVDIQCGPDVEGRTCRGVRPDDPPEPECDALAAEGWVRMCSSWGGTVYDVVMCRTAPDPSGVAERVASASRWIGVGPCSTLGAATPLGVGLAALLLTGRRAPRRA